jgi:hypothetical protein
LRIGHVMRDVLDGDGRLFRGVYGGLGVVFSVFCCLLSAWCFFLRPLRLLRGSEAFLRRWLLSRYALDEKGVCFWKLKAVYVSCFLFVLLFVCSSVFFHGIGLYREGYFFSFLIPRVFSSSIVDC